MSDVKVRSIIRDLYSKIRCKLVQDLKDISWDEETNWDGVQGLETAVNAPEVLKQQLEIKKKTMNHWGTLMNGTLSIENEAKFPKRS